METEEEWERQERSREEMEGRRDGREWGEKGLGLRGNLAPTVISKTHLNSTTVCDGIVFVLVY